MIKIFDTKVSVNVRLFFILAWTSVIANTVGFISNSIFYGLTADTIFYGICAVIMVFVTFFEKKTGKTKESSTVILLLINIIEFPIMYYLYGAGRSVYMILGILGILIFVQKKHRIFLAGLAIAYDVGIMIVSVIYPSTYLKITQESDVGAAVVSFIIVTVSLIMIIILIVKQYETQNQELIDLTENLKLMAIRDPLTKLYNRRYLTDYLEQRMAERESSFAVVLLDLDDFKAINDKYGHVYGDEVLQNFAQCILQVKNENGIAARFGGEEFMLVLNTVDKEKIEAILSQLREEFQQFSMKSKGIRITFSGGAEIFQNEDRITQLFNAADEKLYQAKKSGKNQVIYNF